MLACLLTGLLAAACGRLPTPSWGEYSGDSGAAGGKRGTTPTTLPARLATSTPAPAASTLGVRPADLQGVEISFWHPLSGAAGEEINALAAQFNQENEWGVRVVVTAAGSYDALYAGLAAALEAGAAPGLALAYAAQGRQWDAALLDWAPYVDDAQWGLSSGETSDYFPVFWQEDALGERRWGVPGLRYAQMLFYNQTWAQELGFSQPPQTPDEFRRQACAAAQSYRVDDQRENDGLGGWLIPSGYTPALGWMHAFGAQTWLPGEAGYAFDTPAVGEAFTFLRELYDTGCAWLSASPDAEGEFAARRALMVAGGVTGIPRQEAAFADRGSQDEWLAISFPSTQGQPGIETYGPSFLAFSATPREELAAWLFVRWLTGAESQARLAQAGAHLPVRASSLQQMSVLPAAHPQWAAAAALIPAARAEPPAASWRTARWAVSDAFSQIFRSYFSVDQIPATIKLLDQTSNEFHAK
ncbi:MAG: extracellular solute-binding protein [Chloroflexi bacterium]|nr:extracellular solute-binding protein [Chloroflexota bacterium]